MSFVIGKQINNFDISQFHSGIGHLGPHERASLNHGTGGPRCIPYLYVLAGELHRNEAQETGCNDVEIDCSRRGGPIGGQCFADRPTFHDRSSGSRVSIAGMSAYDELSRAGQEENTAAGEPSETGETG